MKNKQKEWHHATKKKKKVLKNMGWGSGIRDPGSGKNLFRIPDTGVKKAPDPRSGSATLIQEDTIFPHILS
jgi:hypothetical protein